MPAGTMGKRCCTWFAAYTPLPLKVPAVNSRLMNTSFIDQHSACAALLANNKLAQPSRRSPQVSLRRPGV